MMSRNWKYFRGRLRNASLPELFFRSGKALDAARLRLLHRIRKDALPRRPAVAVVDVSRLELPELHGEISPETVKWILDGGLFTLSADAEDLKRAGERLGEIFCTGITSSHAGCDIRQLWEPARLQHVTELIAYIQNGCAIEDWELFTRFAKEALLRWIDANPFLYGPHYTSAMECGLRIPVFFYGLKCIVEPGSREWNILLDAIYRHAWWVSRRLSLHSSLGNHTVAECVGLVFAGGLFRGTEEGKRWLEKTVSLLEKEIHHQILVDGGPAEQSFRYHRFVLDLCWLAIDFLEKNGLHDCNNMKPRLRSGEAFLAVVSHAGKECTSIGDSDDGFAVAPGLFPLRELPGEERNDFRVFRESGYTIARMQDGMSLTFDHGPLGMAPLYNHGHADALSLTVALDSEALLVDPGTYRYNGDSLFRKYFKGTRAHNTVTVDGLDQAVQETVFLWSHPYGVRLTRCDEHDDGASIEAVHDGYSRFPHPVRHRRALTLSSRDGLILRDTFEGSGIHDFELHFHVHPDAKVEFQDGWWSINRGVRSLFLGIREGGEFRWIRGQENPPLGWYSPAYGVKRSSGVLQCARRGTPGEVTFLTLISAGDITDLRRLEEVACHLSPAA